MLSKLILKTLSKIALNILNVCQHHKVLPEETFPGGEVGSLEERVLKNAFYPSKCLDHVGTVVV